MKVSVARTWDGLHARPDEVAHLDLTVGATLRIEVDAPWHGDPRPDGPIGPLWALWEHEVVELFLLGPDEPERTYTEIELGPHGHYLGLRLRGVRNAIDSKWPIAWEVLRSGDRWRGRAEVGLEWLPERIVAFNAYAIHGVGEQRRYLAHAPVPGPQPDFHRLEHFAPWPA